MRVRFDQVFQKSDSQITPIRRIRVGAVTFGPGVSIGPGVAIGGIDFYAYIGRELEVEEREDVLVITGIY